MMNMRKYLIILLFLCFGKAIYGQNDVQPLLLYKAEQDARCRQWVDSVMNRLSLKEKIGSAFYLYPCSGRYKTQSGVTT